jgi:hypothetical protein
MSSLFLVKKFDAQNWTKRGMSMLPSGGFFTFISTAFETVLKGAVYFYVAFYRLSCEGELKQEKLQELNEKNLRMNLLQFFLIFIVSIYRN